MSAPMVVYSNSIPGGFTTGRQMTIRGSTTPGCQRFGIRLTSGTGQARDDIAMFMEVRFDENCVVKNSYISERWGHEERVALPPIARGQPFQIVIVNEPSMYRILVDGRPAADFAHRVSSERVQHVLIDGSVKVDYVTFDGSSGGYPSGPGSYMPPPVAASAPPSSAPSMYPPVPGSVGFADGAPSGPPLVGFGSSGPGYPASSPGYPASSGPGYPGAPGPGYPASSGPGYPSSSGPGYPPTGPGYPLPTSSSSPGYPSSGPGYPSAPGAPQYGGPPTTGPYPPYGAPSAYPPQQPGGYPPQQPGGYPAGYPPQAGYPPSAPGYPQQAPGYPQQPLGGQGHGYGHGPSHGKGGVTGAIQAGVAALGIGGHRSAPGMHTASHGPGMGTMGVLGAGAAAAVLGPKLLKKNKKQKKLLKYGLPAAALGTGAYAMHRGFHRRSSSSSSSSSSSGSEEE